MKQKGLCSICKLTLLNSDNEFMYDGSTHIHHIKRRIDGGSNKLNNLTLVHNQCHMDHPAHEGR